MTVGGCPDSRNFEKILEKMFLEKKILQIMPKRSRAFSTTV